MRRVFHRLVSSAPLLVVALNVGCSSGGGGNVEESLAKSLGDRGLAPASVSCEASGALPYIQDFMEQADAAATCDVQLEDGMAERYCVVSDGGSLIMVTPNRTCEETAADYGRGPGLLEPGELEEQLEYAESP